MNVQSVVFLFILFEQNLSNTIQMKPADIGSGGIGFVPYIGLSLTYDHRAVDGAPASLFLKTIKEEIEDFNVKI